MKTGFYDRTGKAIREGDKVKAIVDGQFVIGTVEDWDDDWIVHSPTWSPLLDQCDDIIILEVD